MYAERGHGKTAIYNRVLFKEGAYLVLSQQTYRPQLGIRNSKIHKLSQFPAFPGSGCRPDVVLDVIS